MREIDGCLEARAAYTNAMAQKLDVAALYRRALDALPDMIDGEPPLPVPTSCPVTLEELLAEI